MSTTDCTPPIETSRLRSVDVTCGNEAAERAQAYVALVGMMSFEVHAPALGQCVEKWALLMAGSNLGQPALLAGLRTVAQRCPMVSLVKACVTLNLDICDVVAEEWAA